MFVRLMSGHLSHCHLDWKGMALDWNRTCLANMHSNQSFGDIYPRRPCHLKVYARQLTLRVDERLLSLDERQAVSCAAAATASGAARVHSGIPASGVGRSEGGVLRVPGLRAGVVADGAATVSAAAGGAALAFRGVRTRQLEAFRKGSEGEPMVNTPVGRKGWHCVQCEYHACKGEPF